MRVIRAAVFALSLGGCAEPGVVRIVDGRPTLGRAISGQAYALYARAAQREAEGDLEGALRFYEAAAREDPDGAEIWTRVGALRCRLAPTSADEAFELGKEADPAHAPLFVERARCALHRGDPPAAIAAAERAVALDPDDLDASILRAAAIERSGRGEEAVHALRALTVRHPGRAAAWLALFDLARRRGDAALALEAARRAREIAPDLAAVLRPAVPALAPLAEIDAALRADDLGKARRLALRARLPAGELGLRAAALGRAALAREQADLVLGADPADASARIALAAAADLAGDAGALGEAMRSIPGRSTPPSPLARLLFAEVLARRAGADAARAWLDATAVGAADPADPLLRETESRVLARLGPR